MWGVKVHSEKGNETQGVRVQKPWVSTKAGSRGEKGVNFKSGNKLKNPGKGEGGGACWWGKAVGGGEAENAQETKGKTLTSTGGVPRVSMVERREKELGQRVLSQY